MKKPTRDAIKIAISTWRHETDAMRGGISRGKKSPGINSPEMLAFGRLLREVERAAQELDESVNLTKPYEFPVVERGNDPIEQHYMAEFNQLVYGMQAPPSNLLDTSGLPDRTKMEKRLRAPGPQILGMEYENLYGDPTRFDPGL